jgi:hypothetical protein
MMISTRCAAIVVPICAAAVRLAAQQSPPTAPAKPDSPAIIEQLDRLKASVIRPFSRRKSSTPSTPSAMSARSPT